MSGCVYLVTNQANGKQYVGLTRLGVATRWQQHVQKSRSPKTYFHRALSKYGEHCFTVVPYVSALNDEYLSALEREVIKSLRPAYNLTNGGEVTAGRKYDDATKEKIRLANTGKRRTPEQCKRISEVKKAQIENDPVFKARLTAQIFQARNASSFKLRQAIASSIASKNRKWSSESRAKLSASCMGRRYGQDVLARMSEAKKRKIVCNNTGVIYSCRVEAARMCGVSPQSVFRVCTGKYKTVKGLSFSYLEN